MEFKEYNASVVERLRLANKDKIGRQRKAPNLGRLVQGLRRFMLLLLLFLPCRLILSHKQSSIRQRADLCFYRYCLNTASLPLLVLMVVL